MINKAKFKEFCEKNEIKLQLNLENQDAVYIYRTDWEKLKKFYKKRPTSTLFWLDFSNAKHEKFSADPYKDMLGRTGMWESNLYGHGFVNFLQDMSHFTEYNLDSCIANEKVMYTYMPEWEMGFSTLDELQTYLDMDLKNHEDIYKLNNDENWKGMIKTIKEKTLEKRELEKSIAELKKKFLNITQRKGAIITDF